MAKTNHSLIWDTLELLVDMTIAKYGDDPQFASTLRHFVEEVCGEPEVTPISKAVHDIWYEHTTPQNREDVMRRKAVLLQLIQQQLSRV